jgi:molecular chaperone DnaJ
MVSLQAEQMRHAQEMFEQMFGDLGGAFNIGGRRKCVTVVPLMFSPQLSSSFSRGSGTMQQRGADVQVNLQLSFMEAVNGTSKALELELESACDACGGKGTADPSSLPTQCPTCKGTGQQIRQVRPPPVAVPVWLALMGVGVGCRTASWRWP